MPGYDHKRQRFLHRYRYGLPHWRQHHDGIRHGHRRRKEGNKPTSHRSRKIDKRQALILSGTALGVIMLVFGLSAWRSIANARRSLEKAQHFASLVVDKPNTLLSKTGRKHAAIALADVQHETKSAQQAIDHSLTLSLLSQLPYFGRQTRGISMLVKDLNSTAAAGSDVLGHLRGLLDSSSATSVNLPKLRQAGAAMGKAEVNLAALHHSGAGLYGPVASARAQFNEGNDHLVGLLHDGAQLSSILNAVLGGDGNKTFLLLGENNAEMRDQGAVLSWALLHTDHGSYTVDNAKGVGSLALDKPVDFSLAPNTDNLFGPLQPRQIWQSTNAWADFPTSGALMAKMYETKKGTPVDGVIAVDVPTLQALLALTGPVSVPGIDQPVSVANVSNILLNKLYQQFPRGDQRERQDLIAATAQAAIDALKQSPVDPARLAKALFAKAAGRHLLVYDASANIQQVVNHYGVSGSVDTKPFTSFHLSIQSAVAAKLDYWVQPRESVKVKLQADGGAIVTTTVTLKNRAPKGAKPSYALGGGPGSPYGPGEYRGRVYLWSPRGSFGAGAVSESGLMVTPAAVSVGPSSKKTIIFQTSIRKLVTDGEISLDFIPQPRVHPVFISVSVDPGPWHLKGKTEGHGLLSRSWNFSRSVSR